MREYIHNLPEWPHFTWDKARLAGPLAEVHRQQGRLLGQMEALGLTVQEEALLRTLTEEVVTTSDIEGETLDADEVRSSVARRLGMDAGGLRAADRHVDGIVEVMVDATRRYDQPLTAERLLWWHASLFPTMRGGKAKLTLGGWRDDRTGPMQVVSGPIGRARVHFEAPAAGRLEREMPSFLDWFNQDGDGAPDGVLKAGLAHLWFVTIHPFDDGNGRIARAIADMALARSEQSPQRFYSMSAQIRQERAAYYAILEAAQIGTMDVTNWLEWFLGCLGRSIVGARTTLSAVLAKARFWQELGQVPLNERQRLVLNRLLDGFEGALTTTKWAAMTKCSQDTALRDISALVERGILIRNSEGGRSTSYAVATAPKP
jgi:Fic family protein